MKKYPEEFEKYWNRSRFGSFENKQSDFYLTYKGAKQLALRAWQAGRRQEARCWASANPPLRAYGIQIGD